MKKNKYGKIILAIILLIITIFTFGFIKQTEIEKVNLNLTDRINLGTASSKTISIYELGDYSGSYGEDRGAHYLTLNDGSDVYCSDLKKELVTNGTWKTTEYEDLYSIDMRNSRSAI